MESSNSETDNINNELDFISLDSLFSQMNGGEDENFYNINVKEFIKYFIYQKDVIVTQDKFYEIISNLIANNKNSIVELLLNIYIVNYYLRDISNNINVKNKLKELYNKLNNETIKFYNKEISKNEIINLLDEEDSKKVYLKLKDLSDENQKYIPDIKPITIIPENIEDKFDICSWEPSEIAKQLAIITQYIFKKIE